MSACRACGAALPDGARFCPACGAARLPATGVAAERKVVTTLFTDLVGFTALGERADPEDVDDALRNYYEMARTVIERFGGAVEKFIGDAVVGLFGVPVAHEDDAERAVRAALEILARMRDLPAVDGERLMVRAAVNTGPALVRLDVLPPSGEGMLVGDAVNTAARLLAAAPTMSVVAGAVTHRLTHHAIAYEVLPRIAVKGKTKPVERWLARGTVARRGVDAGRREATPMIGREVELGIVSGLLDRAIASGTPQYALITGEAGIGKSRLVRELFRLVDERPGFFCTWRQGRCPAYGDGLAFWPLREIVSAHAGIVQGDPPDVIEQKLHNAIEGDADDERFVSRLRPLVGLPGEQTEREENFAVWTRFVEELARTRPTVLVIEDLHWASGPTLEFLAHLVRHVGDVPLLLVGTARPEFLDARPEAAGFGGAVTHLELRALGRRESTRLVAAIARGVCEPDSARLVVAQCGGNPLYAEEFMRYMIERGPGVGTPAEVRAPGSPRQTPDTLQALIAARLDALTPENKALVSGAAVVGPVFWPGALAAIEHGETDAVEEALANLERWEFVRRSADSSFAAEKEFVFRHALIRDVAYEQLPRADRAAKHAAVGRWMRAVAGDRPGDLARNLAFHYAAALELARSTGQHGLASELVEPTALALADAGANASLLDVAEAERYYARALELTRDDAPERPYRLVSWAESLAQNGDLIHASEHLETAVGILREAGELRTAAVVLCRLGDILWLRRDLRCEAVCREAMALLETDDPSPEKSRVHADWAAWCAKNYMGEAAVAAADQALSLDAQLGLPVSARALGWRGMARCDLGDPDGLDDLRRALALAESEGQWLEAGAVRANLSDEILIYAGPRAAMQSSRDNLEVALRRGDLLSVRFHRVASLASLVWLGAWDEALALALEIEEAFASDPDSDDLLHVRLGAALIHSRRGALEDARSVLEWADPERVVDSGARIIILCARGTLRMAEGDREGALAALTRLETEIHRLASFPQFAIWIPTAALTAAAADDLSLAERLIERSYAGRKLDVLTSAAINAWRLGSSHDYAAAAEAHAEAATGWSEFGAAYEAAVTLLWQSRCLLADARPAEAESVLRRAVAALSRLRARPALDEAHALLRQARLDREQAGRG